MNNNIEILTETLSESRNEFVGFYVQNAKKSFNAQKAEKLSQCASSPVLYRQIEESSFRAESAISEAKAEFDAYVAKLSGKITDRIVGAAELTGSLWLGSRLIVETETGKQVWKTALKHNYRYGRNSRNGNRTHYYQFPTKRIA